MKLRSLLIIVSGLTMMLLWMTLVYSMPLASFGMDKWVAAIAPRDKLFHINDTANALYQAAANNNRQEGYKQVQRLIQQLEEGSIPSSQQEAGWTSLYEQATDVKRVLERGKPADDWLTASASLHLGADSLVRPQHSLWLQYEKVLQEDLSRAKQAWRRQSPDRAEAARGAMDVLHDHLSRLEAAALLQRPQDRLSEVSNQILYVNRLLEAHREGIRENKDWTDGAFIALEASIEGLFDSPGKIEEPASAVPVPGTPASGVTIIGLVIIAALTYTVWAKYRGRPYGIKPIDIE
ncbi:sporulation protein YpjB [Paenibacillus sp. GCM10023252]|uniref:sporulation protein YpjB n=1 Tax=Paenibacillus sp. GCM10023252 TaxID=3252649 RepID=UPI0036121AC5